MQRCTRDLATHSWRSMQRLSLSLPDCEGYFEVLLVWVCCWCERQVWADGGIHLTTPPLSPVLWQHTVVQGTVNAYQQQADRTRRVAQQAARIRQRIAQATGRRRRASSSTRRGER